ncbi:hypothetical protein C8C83_4515 [Flavobacterium sp. 90]|nr:hypothetical protein C8C82_4856 [Flavobacterium sp. 81]TCK56498.1 hypothetical protein C8C83_4515 [Flavobacterium sp. 90]
MMKLFKKNKEIRINPKYYLLIQDKWVKKMNTLTSDLSKQSLLIYLILFVIITGSISIYNIYRGLYCKDYKQTDIGIRINSEHLIVAKPSLNITVLPKIEFENISNFSLFIDSLKHTKEGKKIYDSITNCRPGLLDSIVFIKNYYKTNFKK